MKYIILSLFIVLQFSAFAGDYKECKKLFGNEFKNILSQDEGFISAQLSLTALKLGHKILKRSGLRSNTLESYANSIIGNRTLQRLDSSLELQTNVFKLMNKYQPRPYFLDAKAQLESLKNSERLSDNDISSLMSELQAIWSGVDDFGFNENDIAFTALVSNANKLASGEDSYFISDFLNKILSNGLSKEELESAFAKNYKKAQTDLRNSINKVKAKVYSKHKEICLDFYGNNSSAQNVSIFKVGTCAIKSEDEIINSSLLQAIEDIVGSGDLSIKTPALSLEDNNQKLKTQKEKRKLQDKINSEPSNHKKIVDFYKNGFDDSKCAGFTIVDKKRKLSTLYSKEGEEIMRVKSIIGTGKMSSFKTFNPDSVLRKWVVRDSDGNPLSRNNRSIYKYTRTTGAGTYYIDKSLSAQERSERKYDEEFNDRVMVLYSKTENGKREEVQAIHGVPNEPWVSNRGRRMSSFDEDHSEMNLSTGCVNLEGYSYDLINEYTQNNCPIYILPEDEDNYYMIKNGKLKFTTKNKEKRDGSENSLMTLSSGEVIPDPSNTNIYRFTPTDKSNNIKAPLGNYKDSKVLSSLIDNKDELYRRAVKMESDDFEDLLSLTASIETKPEQAKQVFLNLYNAFYRAQILDNAPIKEKRAKILKRYKEDFDSEIKISQALNKSLEIDYENN